MRWLDGITDSMDMNLGKLGVGDGQGGLECCSPCGQKESDTTEWLNWLTDWHGQPHIYQVRQDEGTLSRSFCNQIYLLFPSISFSVVPFSFCLQSFPATGSFPLSQFFVSGAQSIGASASATVLPMNIQDWFPLGWTGWVSLLSKGLSRVFSNTTVQKHQFFGAQLSLWSNSHIHTWLPEKPLLWLDGTLLAK